ncbi:MAG: hypothetical protein C0403_16420 [Desulfobacterium sp.]|nr:hypothetical protein [Desulfobacterium sp.]
MERAGRIFLSIDSLCFVLQKKLLKDYEKIQEENSVSESSYSEIQTLYVQAKKDQAGQSCYIKMPLFV